MRLLKIVFYRTSYAQVNCRRAFEKRFTTLLEKLIRWSLFSVKLPTKLTKKDSVQKIVLTFRVTASMFNLKYLKNNSLEKMDSLFYI